MTKLIQHPFRVLALVYCVMLSASTTFAANTLVGLNTSGTNYQVNPKTGALTLLVDEAFTSFSLGAYTRMNKSAYYVAAPSGSSENAIYTLNLKTNALTHIDLDRSENVKALFMNGKALYGIFYDGNTGAAGIYKIKPKTGVTKLIVDLSNMGLDPVGGSIAKLGNFFYFLSLPSSDSSQRTLVKFRLKAGSAKLVSVLNKSGGTPVLCDKIQPNESKQNFLCLASTTTTQVDAFTLTTKGKAKFLSTLSGIERVAGGATMTKVSDKAYYAFVYALGESNNQRLLKINSKGAIKANVTISTLVIGAQFNQAPAA